MDSTPILTPLQQEKRQRLLEAARELFTEQGYQGTSLNQVIARCGGSKQTIYSYFGDKEGLFKAVITDLTSKVDASFELEALENHPAALRDFARNYLRQLTSPELNKVFRLILSEASRQPELAHYFWANGPMPTQRKIAAYLQQLQQQGYLQIEDVGLAAEQFLASIRGHIKLQALCGSPPPSTGEILRRADSAVSMFLKAHAVDQA